MHGSTRGDLNFAVDDRALGDCDGARADSAANHGGVADFQCALNLEPADDFACDDRLPGPNIAVPAAGYRQIQAPVQFAVAVNLAGNHELTGAADIADDDGLDANEGGSHRSALEEAALEEAVLEEAVLEEAVREKAAFLFAHCPLITPSARDPDVTSLAAPTDGTNRSSARHPRFRSEMRRRMPCYDKTPRHRPAAEQQC